MISFFYFKVELGKYPEKQGLIREHKGLPDGRFTSSVTTSQLWTLMGPDTVGYMDANPKTLHYHLYPKFVWSAVYTGCKIHICTPANQDDILENHHFQQEIHLHSWLDFPASHLIFNRGYGYNHPDFPPDFLYHLGMMTCETWGSQTNKDTQLRPESWSHDDRFSTSAKRIGLWDPNGHL